MKLVESALNLLLPPHCVVCARQGAWFCEACIQQIQPLPEPKCSHCGRPLLQPGLCRRCRIERSYLLSIDSCSAHRQPLRKVIHEFKYGGMAVLSEPLAGLMALTWASRHLQCDRIIPVPLHPARVRERGYNQSTLLARALSRHLHIIVDEKTLVRVRNTPAQVGLSRQERRQNMDGAFCCSSVLEGSAVLLVDDVCTTGATLEACARVLLDAGAASVRALTVARALARISP